MPNVLPPVPSNEPDDTDIQAEDQCEVLPPDDPGEVVVTPVEPGYADELPVVVPAGLNKLAVYTRCGRAVRPPLE